MQEQRMTQELSMVLEVKKKIQWYTTLVVEC